MIARVNYLHKPKQSSSILKYRAQQHLFIIQTLLEKKRIDPSTEVDAEIDSYIDELDKHIDRFIDGTPSQEIVRIDLRIVCRLKICASSGEKYNNLNRLSTRIAQELYDTENHLHHPWEQICGLVHALQPHNTPKKIRAVLEECAKIPQNAEDSLLGLTRILARRTIPTRRLHQRKRTRGICTSPPDAKSWWEQYDIGSRFCQQVCKRICRLSHRCVSI